MTNNDNFNYNKNDVTNTNINDNKNVNALSADANAINNVVIQPNTWPAVTPTTKPSWGYYTSEFRPRYDDESP